MQWPGYTSFVVEAVLPIFISIPRLFDLHFLFIPRVLQSFFVFHAISTQQDRYINVYRNCEYVVHFSNQMYLKKKQTNKQTNKNQPNDIFNRFHSPVIVHRKHDGAVTRHEFLPSSARKHLQLQWAAAPQTPCLQFLFF